MRKIALRKLTFGTLAAVLLASGSAALIASEGSTARQAPAATLALSSTAPRASRPMQVASSYLGITPAQLRAKLRSGESLAQIADATSGRSGAGLIDAIVAARAARLAEARASGAISPASEARRLASMRALVTREVNRVRVIAGSRSLVMQSATSYLGVPAAQLRSELRSGRTLAQIANSRPGKSEAGLVSALVSNRKAALEAMLAASRRRQSTEEARLSSLQQRVTALVNRRLAVGG